MKKLWKPMIFGVNEVQDSIRCNASPQPKRPQLKKYQRIKNTTAKEGWDVRTMSHSFHSWYFYSLVGTVNLEGQLSLTHPLAHYLLRHYRYWYLPFLHVLGLKKVTLSHLRGITLSRNYPHFHKLKSFSSELTLELEIRLNTGLNTGFSLGSNQI